jgi:hypothetical protein
MALKIYNNLDLQSLKVTNMSAGSATGDAVEYDQLNTALALKASVSDLSATTNGDGASLVGIEDGNARFTATTVEGALDEAMAAAQAAALGHGQFWAEADVHQMTGNLTLSGEQTIDGVLTSASRVLVVAQTDASENGLYVTDAGAWTRATDADDSAEFTAYKTVFISGGTIGAGHTMAYTGSDSPVIGTDDLTFVRKSETIINDGSISTAKLANGAVTFAKLAINSVDDSRLQASAVTSGKIVDGAVLESKLNTSVDGETFVLSTEATFTPAAGTVTSADTVFQALQKIQGNISAIDAPTKYSVIASIAGSGGTQTVTHNLGTDYLTFSVRDGSEMVHGVQCDVVTSNQLLFTNDSTNAIAGQITVIG